MFRLLISYSALSFLLEIALYKMNIIVILVVLLFGTIVLYVICPVQKRGVSYFD